MIIVAQEYGAILLDQLRMSMQLKFGVFNDCVGIARVAVDDVVV